jgi:hypothetical protein
MYIRATCWGLVEFVCVKEKELPFPLDVHLLRENESVDGYQRFCPTRGNAVTTTPDQTDLLPNGDGFDLSVADTEHNVIWYRDTCPIDSVMTAFVSVLPDWTNASIAAHADKQDFALAIAVWDDLFSQANSWVAANVVDDNQRTWIQNRLLNEVILNWFISQKYIHIL